MKWVLKFLHHPWTDKVLLVQAVFLLAAIRLGLCLLSVSDIAGAAGKGGHPLPKRNRSGWQTLSHHSGTGEAQCFGNQTELAKDVWPAQRSMIDQLGSLVMHGNPALNPAMASI